jgi:photosystem II stability/assembly factor-like uncharacterized protein
MTPSVSPDPRFRAWLAERAPRVAPPDLLDRSVRAATAVPQASRWALRWPLLRFATPIAATVAFIAVIGTALLLWPPPPTAVVDSSPSSTATAPPEPTPEPTAPPTPGPASSATTVPTPEPIPAFREWTRVDLPDPAPDYLGGGTPVGIARIGEQYVAVGAVRSSNPRAVAWTSSDGHSWELHDDPAGLDAATVSELATDGMRLLAVGLGIESTTCCQGTPEAAWVSVDGTTWTRVDGEAPTLVAGSPSGFVGAFVDSERVRFRRSSDGSSWTDASTAFPGDVADMAMDALGEAVAIGHVTVKSADDDSYATHIVAWGSTGGSRWDERGIVARNAVARSIVAGPSGFVVVGHQTIDRIDGSVFDSARIWRLTASGLSLVPIEFAPGQTFDRVFRIGDDLVATGTEMTELGDAVVAWHSSDGGDHWARIPAQGSLEGGVTAVVAMAGGPDGIVAAGHGLDPESGHLVPVAWVAAR